MIFSRSGVDFRSKNPPKNDPKTRWNRSRTAKPESLKNDTPPIVFASDAYKKLFIILTGFGANFAGFSSHLEPQNLKIATEISCKIHTKNHLKMISTILILAPKMDCFCVDVFGY